MVAIAGKIIWFDRVSVVELHNGPFLLQKKAHHSRSKALQVKWTKKEKKKKNYKKSTKKMVQKVQGAVLMAAAAIRLLKGGWM